MGASVRPIDPFDEALQATRQAAPSQTTPDPFDQALSLVRPKRPPLLKRLGTAVADMATRVDPETGRRTFSPSAVGETAKGIVLAPVHTVKAAGDYIGQTAAELTLPQELQNLAYQDPTRMSERDAAFTAAQTAALGVPFTRAGKFLSPANKATKTAVQTAYGAGTGAVFTPDDPAVGAILGGGTGAAVSKVADAYTARRASAKAQADETAARRTKAGSGETVTGPIRRVPRETITPERLEDISYRPDPLAEHVVKPEAPKAPAAAESYPLGTTAEGSGPMFQLRRTAFATGQAVRRPKVAEPIPEAPPVEVPAGPPVVEPQGSLRVSAEWQAAYESATPRQQAEMLAVRFRPNNAAEPIVPTPAEFAKAQELIAKRPSGPTPEAPAPAPLETVSAGSDVAAPSRVPLTPVARARPPKTPRGVEPSGTVTTTEGAVSAGVGPDAPVRSPALEAPVKSLDAPPATAPTAAPDPATAPREYLNFAKFGLDQATEARLRDNVASLRASGEVDKGYKSFADQRAEANRFARELVADPLRIDQAKLQNLSGPEIVGLRRVVGENTRVMEGLSKAIESGQLTPDELKLASDMIDRATVSTNEVLGAIVRETAQTARDLGFLRQMAKLSTDPEAWIVRGKKMLGDRPMTDRMMTEIRRLAREAADACA